MDVTVTSPLGQDLPLEVKSWQEEKDIDLIEFCPSVPGNYKFNITYGGEEVPGSPIVFMVEDTGVAKASGEGLQGGQVDGPTSFKISGVGLAGEPSVKVDGPDSVAKCLIERESDGIFAATYSPTEVGIFDVQVLWDSVPVSGECFYFK